MTNLRIAKTVSACALVLLAAACASVDEAEVTPEVDQNDLTQGVDQGTLWQSRKITYCFEAPRLAAMPASVRAVVTTEAALASRWQQRKQQFIDAINRTWQAAGVLQFIAQDGCVAGAAPVSYDVDTPTGGFAGLGRNGGGIHMDAEFLGNTYPAASTYHSFVAAHEMGHVLGFRHEQDRTDSTCHVSQDFSGVGIKLTGYDANSIMNYCNNQQTVLTELDKQGFRNAYAFLPAGGGTPDAGGAQCTNVNANCNYWASIGECAKNPGYMLVSCCASCAATCVDKNAQCAAWAAAGECARNPGYMRPNCCASCR